MPNIRHHRSAASSRPTVACEIPEKLAFSLSPTFQNVKQIPRKTFKFAFENRVIIYNPLFLNCSTRILGERSSVIPLISRWATTFCFIQPPRFYVFLLAQTIYFHRLFSSKRPRITGPQRQCEPSTTEAGLAHRLLYKIYVGPTLKGLVANAPTPKPPSESVRGRGGRRHAEACRKREQESPGKRARGIQRAVNAAFHEATVRGQGNKMERREESEPEQQGRGRGDGRRAPSRASSLTRQRGRERGGGPFSPPHTRGPAARGLARREAPAGRRQQWGVRRQRGRGWRRRLHGGPRPRSGPRDRPHHLRPAKRCGRTRGEGGTAPGSGGTAHGRQGRTVCSRADSHPAAGPGQHRTRQRALLRRRGPGPSHTWLNSSPTSA